MTDQFDRASEIEQMDRDAALRRQATARKQSAMIPSAIECRDCGDEIPKARRAAVPGVQFCVDCQVTQRG